MGMLNYNGLGFNRVFSGMKSYIAFHAGALKHNTPIS